MTQFVFPDDKHEVLETCRVKNKDKYIEKNCVSRWSFTKNHYMMYRQQNMKLCSLFVEHWLRDQGFDSHQEKGRFRFKKCVDRSWRSPPTHSNLKMGTAFSFPGDKSMGV